MMSLSSSVAQSSSIVNISTKQIKSKRTQSTITTIDQEMTEHECEPFFINLRTVPFSQLDHLRKVGLLVEQSDNNIHDNRKNDRDVDDDKDENDDDILVEIDNSTTNEIIIDVDTVTKNEEIHTNEIISPAPPQLTHSSSTSTTVQKNIHHQTQPQQQQGQDDDNSSRHDDSVFDICLLRAKHSEYLQQIWNLDCPLRSSFVSLDASRPWMIYWCLHGYDLLMSTPMSNTTTSANSSSGSSSGTDNAIPKTTTTTTETSKYGSSHFLTEPQRKSIVQTLQLCFTKTTVKIKKDIVKRDWYLLKLAAASKTDITTTNPNNDSENDDYIEFTNVGGFGGGIGQLAHAATTYAAVNALCILAPIEPLAYQLLQQIKEQMYPWFISLLHPSNHGTSMRMHHDGEIDVRASYCILAASSLLGLLQQLHSPSSSSSSPVSSTGTSTNPTTSTSESSSSGCLLLDKSIIEFIAQCQTYEGGFGGEPFSEAHGGYTFCALAAIQIWLMHQPHHHYHLQTTHRTNCTTSTGSNSLNSPWEYVQAVIHISNLSGWLVRRQMSFEGGFNGRCNKLVDGCYSFWQGSATAIVSVWEQEILSSSRQKTVFDGTSFVQKQQDHVKDPWMYMYKNSSNNSCNSKKKNNPTTTEEKEDSLVYETDDNTTTTTTNVEVLFDAGMLQRYILLCAQDVHGGLRDKPSKSRDFYHTCYNLSGLSISQHYSSSSSSSSSPIPTILFGHEHHSRVEQTHPCYNICMDKVQYIQQMHEQNKERIKQQHSS